MAQWGIQEQLLAAAVDALNAANWQRGGGKGRKPSPMPRPGVKPSATVLGKAEPLDTIKAKLARWEERSARGEQRALAPTKLPPHLRGLVGHI